MYNILFLLCESLSLHIVKIIRLLPCLLCFYGYSESYVCTCACAALSRLAKPKCEHGGDALCKLMLNIMVISFSCIPRGREGFTFSPGVKRRRVNPLM